MNPATFEHHTKVLMRPAEMTDEECGPLPVYCDGEQCISLWRLSWRERISALVFGRVWLQVLSGNSQPPVTLRAERTIFEVDSAQKTDLLRGNDNSVDND